MMADSNSERQRKVKAGREKLLQFQQRKRRKREGKSSASSSPTPSEASTRDESHNNNNNSSHADLRDVSKETHEALSILSKEYNNIATDADDTDNDLQSLASNASEVVSQNGDHSCSEYTSGEESYSYSTEDGNADSLAIARLEVNEYKEKVIGLEENLRGKQEALKEVNKENFELRAKLQVFETSKRHETTSSPVLKREIEDLHNALRNKQHALEDINVENRDLRSRLANKGNEEEISPAQLEELRFNLSSKQTTLRELSRQNEGLSAEIAKLKSEIEEQVDSQKQSGYEVNRIKALLDERDKDIDHLKSVITENTLALDRLTTEEEALGAEKNELQSRLNEAAAEIRGLKRANENLSQDKTVLDEKLFESSTRIDELEDSLKTDQDWNDVNEDTEMLQEDLMAKIKRINGLEYQVSMAIGERDALHLEAQTDTEEFREQIEGLQRQIEEDNQMLACHEESIDKASRDLSSSIEQVLNLQQSLKTEHDNVLRLEVELLQIKEHCEERIQNMKSSYDADHFEKVNCVEAKDAEINELTEKYNKCVNDLQCTHNDHSTQVASLENELEQMRKYSDEQLAEVELIYSKKITDLESDAMKNDELEKEAAHVQLNHAIHDLKTRHQVEVESFTNELDKKATEVLKFQKDFEMQIEICSNLEAELLASQHETKSKEIQVTGYANEVIPQLQCKIEELKAETSELQQKLDNAHESHAAVVDCLKQSRRMTLSGLNELKDEKDIIKRRLEENLTEIQNECKMKMNEWSTSALPLFTYNQAEFSSCQNELCQLKQDCLSLKTEVETLQLERNDLNSQLHDKSKDFENVKVQCENLIAMANRSSTPSPVPATLLSPNDDSSIVDANSSLVNDLKGQLDHVKFTHQKQMEQLQADFESDLKFLEEENERLGSEVVALRDQYEKEKLLIADRKTKECEDVVERCRSESTAIQDETEKAFYDEIEKLKNDHAEELMRLQEHNDARLQEINQTNVKEQDNLLCELKEAMLLEKRTEIEHVTSNLMHEQANSMATLKQQTEADLHQVKMEKQNELAALKESLEKSRDGDIADNNEVLICELKSITMKYEHGEEMLRQKEQELANSASERNTQIAKIIELKNIAMETIKRCLTADVDDNADASYQKINDIINSQQMSEDHIGSVVKSLVIFEEEFKTRIASLYSSKQANHDMKQHINQLLADNIQLSDTVSKLKSELDNNFMLQGDTTQEKAVIEKALNELLMEKISLEEKLKAAETSLNESISKIKEFEIQKADSIDAASQENNTSQLSNADIESIPFARASDDEANSGQEVIEGENVELQLKHMETLLLEHCKREEGLKNEIKQLQSKVKEEHAMFTQQITDESSKRKQLEAQLKEMNLCHDTDIIKATEDMQQRLVDAIREEEAVLAENKHLLGLIEQNSVEAIKEKTMLQMQIMKQEETIQELRDKVLTGDVVTTDLQDLFSRQMAHLETQRDELLERLDEQKSEQQSYVSVIHENSTLTSTHRREKQNLLDKLREKDKLERTLHREKSLLDGKVSQLQKLRHTLSHKEELEKELLFQRNSLQGELIAVENHLLSKEEQLYKEKSHLESELQSKDRNLVKWEEDFARREKLHSQRVNKLRQHYANQLESTRHDLERTHEQSMRRLHSDLYNNAQKRIQSMEDISQLRHGSDISSIRLDYNDQLEDWYQICDWLLESWLNLPCFKNSFCLNSQLSERLYGLKERLSMDRDSLQPTLPSNRDETGRSSSEGLISSDDEDDGVGRCLQVMHQEEIENLQIDMLVDTTIRIEACRLQNEISTRKRLADFASSLTRDTISKDEGISQLMSDEDTDAEIHLSTDGDDTKGSREIHEPRQADIAIVKSTTMSLDQATVNLHSMIDNVTDNETYEELSDGTSLSDCSSSTSRASLTMLRRNNTELETDLDKCRSEINSVKDEMDALKEILLREQVEGFAKMKDSFQLQRNALLWGFSSDRALIECQFAERERALQAEHLREINEVRRMTMKETEEREKIANEELEKIKLELTTRNLQFEQQRRREIEIERERYEMALSEQTKDEVTCLNKELEVLRQKSKEDLNNLTFQIGQDRSIDTTDGQAPKSNEKIVVDEQIIDNQDLHDQSFQTTVAKLQVEHVITMAAMKEKLKEKYEKKIDKIREQTCRDFEKSAAWQNSIIDQVNDEHEEDMNKLKDKMKKSHEKRMMVLQAGHTDELKSLQSKVNSLESELKSKQEEYNRSVSRSSLSSGEFDLRVSVFVDDVIRNAIEDLSAHRQDEIRSISRSTNESNRDQNMPSSLDTSIDNQSQLSGMASGDANTPNKSKSPSDDGRKSSDKEVSSLQYRIEALQETNDTLERRLSESVKSNGTEGSQDIATSTSLATQSSDPEGDMEEEAHPMKGTLELIEQSKANNKNIVLDEKDVDNVHYVNNDVLVKDIEKLTEKIEIMKKELQNKDLEKNETITNNMEQLQQLKNFYENKIDKMQDDAKRIQEDEINAVTMATEDELERTKLDLDRAHREEMDDMNMSLINANAKIIALEAMNAGIESSCEDHISSLKLECTSDIDELKQALEKSYSEELDSFEKRLAKQREYLEEQKTHALNLLEKELTGKFNKELAFEKANTEECRVKLLDAEATCDELVKVRCAYDEVSLKLIHLQNDMKSMQESNQMNSSSAVTKIDELEIQLRETKAHLESADVSILDHIEEKQILERQLKDTTISCNKYLLDKDNIILELRADNQLLSDAKRSLEMQLAQLRTSVEDDRFSRQQSQVRLSASSPLLEGKYEDLKNEIDEMKDIIGSLHQEKLDLEEKLSNQHDCNGLISEREKLHTALNDLAAENDSLGNENSELRKRIGSLQKTSFTNETSQFNPDDTEKTYFGENFTLHPSMIDSYVQEQDKNARPTSNNRVSDESGNGTMEIEAVLIREQNLQIQAHHLQEAIESLRSANEQLYSDLDLKTETEIDLQKQVTELEAKVSRLKSLSTEDCQSAQEQLNRLIDDNKRLLNDMNEVNRLRSVTEKTLQDKENEIHSLKNDIDGFEPLRDTVKKLEHGMKVKDDTVKELNEKNHAIEELLLTKENEVSRLSSEFVRLEETKVEQQQLLESQHRRILELIERQGSLESKIEYIEELERLVTETQALSDVKGAQLEALKARSRQTTPLGHHAEIESATLKIEDLQNTLIGVEKENIRLSALLEQQSDEIAHLRHSQTDAAERMTKEFARQNEENAMKLKHQHQQEMDKILEMSRVDNDAELERRLDEILGATEQQDKRLMDRFIRNRSSIAANILTPKIEGRHQGQTIVQTLLGDLQAEAEEICNLILEYPHLDETADNVTIKSLQQAWSAEKQSLLNAVKALRDLVAKTSHTVLIGSSTDNEVDWRTDLLASVKNIFSRENDVLKSELETLRLLAGSKHVAPELIEEATKHIKQHGSDMAAALRDLNEKDRESLLTEIKSLNSLLKHSQMALQEYKTGHKEKPVEVQTRPDSQLAVRLRDELEEALDRVSELTRQLNREKRSLDEANQIDNTKQLKIKELTQSVNDRNNELSQLRSLYESEKKNSESLTSKCSRLSEVEMEFENVKRMFKESKVTLGKERSERQKLENVAERYRSNVEELKSMFSGEKHKRENAEKRCTALVNASNETEQTAAVSRSEKERLKDVLAEERRLKNDALHSFQLAEIKLATFKAEMDSRSAGTPSESAIAAGNQQQRIDEITKALIEEKQNVASLLDNIKLLKNASLSSKNHQQSNERLQTLENEKTELRATLVSLEKQVMLHRARENDLEKEAKQSIAIEQQRWSAEKAKLQAALKASCVGKMESSNIPAATGDSSSEKLDVSGWTTAKVQRLYRKYLRSESFRKSLVYQKKYLLHLLGGYHHTEKIVLSSLANMNSTAIAPQPPTIDRSSPKSKFRSAVRAVIAIHRLKFIVKRRQRCVAKMFPSQSTNDCLSPGRSSAGSSARSSCSNSADGSPSAERAKQDFILNSPSVIRGSAVAKDSVSYPTSKRSLFPQHPSAHGKPKVMKQSKSAGEIRSYSSRIMPIANKYSDNSNDFKLQLKRSVDTYKSLYVVNDASPPRAYPRPSSPGRNNRIPPDSPPVRDRVSSNGLYQSSNNNNNNIGTDLSFDIGNDEESAALKAYIKRLDSLQEGLLNNRVSSSSERTNSYY